jgi:hypothetical protein
MDVSGTKQWENVICMFVHKLLSNHAEEHLTVDVFAEYDPRDNAVNTLSSRGDAPRDNDQGRYAYLLES